MSKTIKTNVNKRTQNDKNHIQNSKNHAHYCAYYAHGLCPRVSQDQVELVVPKVGPQPSFRVELGLAAKNLQQPLWVLYDFGRDSFV